MVLPADTSRDAWARLVAGLRALTPQERLRLAASMSDEIRDLARDGLRHRHPAWTGGEINRALEDVLLGPDLAAAAAHFNRATDGTMVVPTEYLEVVIVKR